ncbi:MAG: A/G-specific adenine glycosylase [Lachnospiraceae bacterium]|nr:A/G-specific adenine glycosylase [Lachnospiraceae bacterium]
MSIYEEMIPYLLHWYKYNARVLPWREDPSAYHVWVSEIMLQQTRVEAVRGYYMRFLDALPTVKALAECPDDRLLKLWEGLGYYSRARNLKKAAGVICEQYGGVLPSEVTELRKLPGIGDYTAGAIASIAFHKPEPAVDGNLLRVLSRVSGSRENIDLPEVRKRMAAELKAVMPKEESGELNQAIMDIGATICIPNGAPHCEDCPIVHLCTAYREDTVSEIPVREAKRARRIEKKTVFLITKGEKILLHKRPASGLLAGMYEYPNVPGHVAKKDVVETVMAWVGEAGMGLAGVAVREMLATSAGEAAGEATAITKAKSAKHIFSHIEWHMNAWRVTISDEAETGVSGTAAEVPVDGYVWSTEEELRTLYSLPSAFSKWDVFEKGTD